MSTPVPGLRVVPLADADRAWADDLLTRAWGGTQSVTRGVLYDLREYPGLVAVHDSTRAGLLVYRLVGRECEIMTLNSVIEGVGVGTALLGAVRDIAQAAGCARLWLITTNDNTHALRFYQRRGFRLAALYPNALAISRRLKPQIPLGGLDGIPLRDELELEIVLE